MRRTLAVTAAVSVIAVSFTAFAQAPAPRMLPLDNLGLEHLDIVVPDPAASAGFYARVFKTTLHQQPVRDTLRFFVLLGDLPQDRQVGYIAIGAAGDRAPSIGHYCVLAKVYERTGFARALQTAALPAVPTGAGGLGMWPDPDGLELQLFQPPAGLVTAAVKSPLPVDSEGIVSPIGLDHVVLLVSNLERSLPYYRQVYGQSAERPRDAHGRVWFHIAGDTRIGLQEITDGRKPSIGHFAVKVSPFDRNALMGRLRELSAEAMTSGDEPDVIRFRDNNGIIVELRVAD